MDIRLTDSNLVFKFKNIIYEKTLNIYRFLFTHKSSTIMLCLEIDEVREFLDSVYKNKYLVNENKEFREDVIDIGLVVNLLDDLIDNLSFYTFGYNQNIKSFTITNIIYLRDKICNIIILSKDIRESTIIKNKIKDKLFELINCDSDNKNIYKKIWFLINHFDSINYEIIKENKMELTFTLNDFIFDYYK
jgi:hypothetical protein